MNEDGTSVVTPVQRTSMTLQLQQPSISAPAPQVQQNVQGGPKIGTILVRLNI